MTESGSKFEPNGINPSQPEREGSFDIEITQPENLFKEIKQRFGDMRALNSDQFSIKEVWKLSRLDPEGFNNTTVAMVMRDKKSSNNDLIGWAIVDVDGHIIRSLDILKEFQGKGLATRIIKSLQEEFSKLEADPDLNEKSKGLLKKLGFKLNKESMYEWKKELA